MTRVRHAESVAAEMEVLASWEALAAQPVMPLDPIERYDWLQRLPIVSDRVLAVTALQVLRDESTPASRLHTKAIGLLYRAAKLSIEAMVVRLTRRPARGLSTGRARDDAILLVDDIVSEAIVKTVAQTGGEWVVYVALRINGQIANHLTRTVAKEVRCVSLYETTEDSRPGSGEAVPTPSASKIEAVLLDGIRAVTTNDLQARALEALFAVGRFHGLSGDGMNSQAQAAALTGFSQQRISALQLRLKTHLYDQLGVVGDNLV